MYRESLRDVRAPYELLFEKSPNPKWVVDVATLAFVSVNDAAVARYGYSRVEFLAMTIRDIRSPEEQPALDRSLARSADAWGVPVGARHKTKSGAVIDVEVYATPFEAEGSKRILVCAVDVTALKRAEAEARAAERRLRMLMERNFDGLSLGTADGRIEYVNSALTRILGRDPREAVGKFSGGWVHPDDAAREKTTFARVLRTPNASHTTVMRNLHADGSWRWVESTTTNLLDDPDVRAIVATFRDVTDRVRAEEERKELEEALRRSDRDLRALLDHLPSGVFVHRQGRIVYANQTIATLLSYAEGADLHGLTPFELTPPERHEVIRARVRALESQSRTYNPPQAGEMVRRDGSRVAVEIEALRVDFDGEPANLVLVRDLSERREMLARMAVADRMRSVGMLAAGVAHEINNPLAYVLTNVELVEEELRNPVRRLRPSDIGQLLHDARDGALRVRDVVQDLRMLSRDDGDALGSTRLGGVLESCVKMVAKEVRYRARLVAQIEPTPPVCGTDSRLGQVFLNLLLNAAHAIPEGHADENEVVVRARQIDASAVLVEIADTGCGIPPEIIGRIFDPFFTTKPPGIGTGLGLAICHGIVKSLEGTIDVESEPGRGTTFRVTLPIAPVSELREESSEGSAPAPRRRILVVDDEPAIGTMLRLLLQHEHDVVTVTCARDALSRIDAGEYYDMVLCDLMMPEMSGIELFTTVERARPALASRFVFLTGGAFTDASREFMALNKNPHLEKPFTAKTLRDLFAGTLRA